MELVRFFWYVVWALKAFEINRAPGLKDSGIDFGPDYFLPDVFCPACGEEWGAPWFSFPAVHPPWIAEFPYKEDGDNPVVSWKDFLKLRQRLAKWNPCAPEVIPGAAFGNFSGTSTRKKLPGFFCDGFDIVVSPEIRASLEALGIKETWAPVSIKCRGERTDERFCAQPRVFYAITAARRKELIRRECRICGFLDLHPSVQNNLRSAFCLLQKSVAREAPNFFLVRETGVLVFTERFLRILEKLDVLKDLTPRQMGVFV